MQTAEPDLEVIDMTDFEFEPPCDASITTTNPVIECPNAAEWILLYDCGCTRMRCTGCKDETIRMSNTTEPNIIFTCSTCSKQGRTHIHKVVRVEPIRGT